MDLEKNCSLHFQQKKIEKERKKWVSGGFEPPTAGSEIVKEPIYFSVYFFCARGAPGQGPNCEENTLFWRNRDCSVKMSEISKIFPSSSSISAFIFPSPYWIRPAASVNMW